MIKLLIIAILLLALEQVCFKLADHFNIIDKPNERFSHSSIVLRGGGVIFSLAMVAWAVLMVVQGECGVVMEYLPFLVGLLLCCVAEWWRSFMMSLRGHVVQLMKCQLAVLYVR